VAHASLPAAGGAHGTVTPFKTSTIQPCADPAFCKPARQGLSRPARCHLNRSGLERHLSAHTSQRGTQAKRRAWDGCHDIRGRVPVRKHPVCGCRTGRMAAYLFLPDVPAAFRGADPCLGRISG
jgi:hypothetical protein